ncbi:MAG: hypothetical protein IRY83_17885 [Chloroflexi bacterium]|nr:hypothetical protein [Chloroflexota bacterium]
MTFVRVREAGQVMLWVLVAVAVVGVLGTASLIAVSQQVYDAGHARARAQALDLAEAGLDRAAAELVARGYWLDPAGTLRNQAAPTGTYDVVLTDAVQGVHARATGRAGDIARRVDADFAFRFDPVLETPRDPGLVVLKTSQLDVEGDIDVTGDFWVNGPVTLEDKVDVTVSGSFFCVGPVSKNGNATAPPCTTVPPLPLPAAMRDRVGTWNWYAAHATAPCALPSDKDKKNGTVTYADALIACPQDLDSVAGTIAGRGFVAVRGNVNIVDDLVLEPGGQAFLLVLGDLFTAKNVAVDVPVMVTGTTHMGDGSTFAAGLWTYDLDTTDVKPNGKPKKKKSHGAFFDDGGIDAIRETPLPGTPGMRVVMQNWTPDRP